MRLLATIAALLLGAGASAASPRLSLNGVAIDGATSQRIEGATVVIDENGNVDIIAKGYAVSQLGEASASGSRGSAGDARPASALSRRYWLVSEQSQRDGTQFDVAVFINGRWVKELKSSEEAAPFEVTRFLVPGPNEVVLVATKRLSGSRRSTSRDVTSRVAIGEGPASGQAGAIESAPVEMRRDASETGTFTEQHQLVAR